MSVAIQAADDVDAQVKKIASTRSLARIIPRINRVRMTVAALSIFQTSPSPSAQSIAPYRGDQRPRPGLTRLRRAVLTKPIERSSKPVWKRLNIQTSRSARFATGYCRSTRLKGWTSARYVSLGRRGNRTDRVPIGALFDCYSPLSTSLSVVVDSASCLSEPPRQPAAICPASISMS
ncbi:MAG: hypothetical protein J07HX5_00951 [halophilic archaeon J07HX5]|nr:MAG: hypothetical protein J07HX5_00951 [halophilic archaeon J07HX5]